MVPIRPRRHCRSSLVDAVLSASRVFVAIAARSLADTAEEVTLAQYRTLVVLASRGPQTLAGLASNIEVTPATATRMCDRLVRKGLIRRTHERGDRRTVRLDLTSSGRSLVDAVTRRRRKRDPDSAQVRSRRASSLNSCARSVDLPSWVARCPNKTGRRAGTSSERIRRHAAVTPAARAAVAADDGDQMAGVGNVRPEMARAGRTHWGGLRTRRRRLL